MKATNGGRNTLELCCQSKTRVTQYSVHRGTKNFTIALMREVEAAAYDNDIATVYHIRAEFVSRCETSDGPHPRSCPTRKRSTTILIHTV